MNSTKSIIMERKGYGSHFNTIEFIDEVVKKSAKNNYGQDKIKQEIHFYLYLIRFKIQFQVPTILDYSLENNHYYSMTCMKNYKELYIVFPSFHEKQKIKILKNIFDSLNILHQHTKSVEKHQVIQDVYLETIHKINTRLICIQKMIDKYSHIDTIYCHGQFIKRKSIHEILEKIKTNVDEYCKSLDDVTDYSLIHGDCQFNNILMNESDDLVFIDPRGYFGNTLLFGLKEYDIAKIYFALSGYDEFDNRSIETLDIENNTIQIHLDILDSSIFNKNKFIKTLVISIWLSNAHIFMENENKCIHSFFIAIYLASCYL